MGANERLRAWRCSAGLSQTEAARRLGVSQGTWSAWEAGWKRPELEPMLELERLTGGSVAVNDWVLSPEEREARRVRRGGRAAE